MGGLFIETRNIEQDETEQIQDTVKTKVRDSKNILIINQMGFSVGAYPQVQPKLTLIVATAQGLKMHGGVSLDLIKEPNMEGLVEGVKNLDKHIENLRKFGQTVAVAFNRYANDSEEEIEFVRQHCAEMGVGFAVNNAFAEGGNGAIELANLVVDTIEKQPSGMWS